ncbi:MAG TPA: siroheme synthase CysG [Nitrosomonas sp.]|nr:siroheme synthase CysG [Nitrosomonas sp.]
MDFFPIFLNIRDRKCLVVGGGEIAARKVELLLKANALVTVISPTLGETLEAFSSQSQISYIRDIFYPKYLTNYTLVISATNNHQVNQQVWEEAIKANIPVNVVDNLSLCSFIMPAIIDRSPVVIAISSSGKSPVLVRMLRTRLETLIPSAYGKLAQYLGEFRDLVKQHFILPEQRRFFWEKLLQSPFVEMVLSGKDQAAQQYLIKSIENDPKDLPQGEVYLVGAGPGNPDLLTLRALQLMQQADVIVYDRLVSKSIMDLTRRDATRIYAGKERNNHTLSQESINELLVRLAKDGKRVLRLKGGDPFIFGRGGEEIETLSEHRIPFQVVPGITAASGVASYAGIPLTHRDYAQSCTFVAGHLKHNSLDLDWNTLARPQQTIVVYMGLLGLPILCEQLIAHGLPATTPAAIVQQATTNNQRVVIGSLDTLPSLAMNAHIVPPTLIIIGEVVKLHQKLTWYHYDY